MTRIAPDPLSEESAMQRIYLDNAATSWPKPEAVYRAMDHYQREVGAAVGRGVYGDAVKAQDMVEQTRRAVARLIARACRGTWSSRSTAPIR